MRKPRRIQLASGLAIVVLAVIALANRGTIGVKGTPVPASSIALCVLASGVAAYLTARGWHWLPAPFIAGIVGVFMGDRLGPVGGAFGLLVGLAVVLAVVAESRLIKSRHADPVP